MWLLGATARAEPVELQPILMTELDATVYSDELEGETGLRVARLRLGGTARVAPWLTGFGVAEVAIREAPVLLDAGVRLQPVAWLDVTVGYDKTPLFATAHDIPVETTALPDFPLVTRALWRQRDLGIEGHLREPALPLEAFVRLGNGSGTSYGNDNAAPSLEARLDLTAGRGRHQAEGDEVFGLRAGAGAHVENADDRSAIAGETPTGFLFWRSPTVSGPMQLVAAHALVWLGPTTLSAEGGWAREGRSRDDDGNPDTPRLALDPVSSWGGVGELAVAVAGPWRVPGAWPSAGQDQPTVELATRVERLSTGLGADDVAPGGILALEGGGRLWSPRGLAFGLSGYWASYDIAPLETPDRTTTWGTRARLTFSLRPSMGSAAGG